MYLYIKTTEYRLYSGHYLFLTINSHLLHLVVITKHYRRDISDYPALWWQNIK